MQNSPVCNVVVKQKMKAFIYRWDPCLSLRIKNYDILYILFAHALSLRSYSEDFWFVFSGIWTEYREIGIISSYSIPVRENTDQKNSQCRYFYPVVEALFNLNKAIAISWLKKYLLTGFPEKSQIMTSVCGNTRLHQSKWLWIILQPKTGNQRQL